MYKLKTFDNGLRVLVDEDKNVATVSVSFLLLAGGKDEDDTRSRTHRGQEAPLRGRFHRTRHPAEGNGGFPL